jgi:hypothetical protein
VPIQYLVDVHHSSHATSVHDEGRLARPGVSPSSATAGGGREGGLPPSR